MKAIWRWRRKIARRGILAALLTAALLAGGCAYNGYYTDYPYTEARILTTTEAPILTTEAPILTTEAPIRTTEAPTLTTTEAPILLRLFRRVFDPSARPLW